MRVVLIFSLSKRANMYISPNVKLFKINSRQKTLCVTFRPDGVSKIRYFNTERNETGVNLTDIC